MEALCSCSQFKNGDAKVLTSVYRNFSYDTLHVFIHQKTDKQSKNCLLLSKISQSNCNWLFFCCKIWSAIWGYLGFRSTTQRHHMGISGIWSKQLRAPLVSSRLDGLKFKADSLLARKYSSGQSVFQ